MEVTHYEVKLTNTVKKNSVEVNALVSTGDMFMCVPEEIAIQLGFDLEVVSRVMVTLADGSHEYVPRISPIEVVFQDRTHAIEALVLGNKSLISVMLLEAMGLV